MAWFAAEEADVSGDFELAARAEAVLAAYDGAPQAEDDRVLVHADLGLHVSSSTLRPCVWTACSITATPRGTTDVVIFVIWS